MAALRGEQCGNKVRAITRIAAAENEAELLELARHATAARVEKLKRCYRRAGRLEERERTVAQQASRELAYYFDIAVLVSRSGKIESSGILTPEIGRDYHMIRVGLLLIYYT